MVTDSQAGGAQRLRILFVTRAMSHYSYHASTINHLRDRGHRVHVLFGRDGTEGGYSYGLVTDDKETRFVIDSLSRNDDDKPLSSQVIDTHGLELSMSQTRNDRWVKLLVGLRETRSYASYLARGDTSVFAGVQRRWIPGWIKSLTAIPKLGWFVRRFLASGPVRKAMAALENAVPPNSEITRWMENENPDVVVVSPVNFPNRPEDFSGEIEYLKSARSLGIATVAPVFSWDNLIARGLYHVQPDVLLAWNQPHVRDAVNVHGIPLDQIVITGSPTFDKWFDTDTLAEDRDVFCARVGVPQDRPFILYLGSSGNIASDETWLIRELVDALKRHPNPKVSEMHLLVRPHPANTRQYESLAGKHISVWPKEGALPDSDTSLGDFHNSLRYCVSTVGINTTGMVDALVNNKPCVTIITERYSHSQMEAAHFHHLLDSDVLELTYSVEECVDAIENLAQGVDRKCEARARFLRDFIRPRGVDRPAGEAVALAIEMAAQRKSAKEIDAAINQPSVPASV